MIDRLALAELHLGFAQHFDDLFRRVPLPCNSRRSSSEVANSQIRSISVVAIQESRPEAAWPV